MGCSKSTSKREVYSNKILPQETRKTSNRQPNFTPKTTGKRRTKKINRRQEIIKIQAEINEKEMKETIVKIKKLKAGSLRRQKKWQTFSQTHPEKERRIKSTKLEMKRARL